MKRRVLFTASTYSHVVHFHRPYLAEFARLGWGVDVACGGAPMDIPEAEEVFSIPFEKKLTAPQNTRATAALRRLIRAREYALVSCHTSLAAFFTRAAVLGLPRRPRVACTCHGYLFDDATPAPKRALLASAERLTAPVTDLLMTMNRWDTEYARRHRLGKEVVEIPGMGVDLHRHRRADRGEGLALRRSLGFADHQFLLVYAAEFSQRKSHRDLLCALQQLPPSIGLLLPGSGALWEECRTLARGLGVADRVAFPGQVGDMAPWYAAADGAVTTSRSEGLPFNVMEAMAAGLPVAASAVKGHVDLIRDGETGLLFPYGDPTACAARLLRLAQDPDLAHRLGTQAALEVQNYSLDRVLPQVMGAYSGLVVLEEVGVRRDEVGVRS